MKTFITCVCAVTFALTMSTAIIQSVKADTKRCWNCAQIYYPTPQKPNCPYCSAPPEKPKPTR